CWLLAADLLTVDDQRLVVRLERKAAHVPDVASFGRSHELTRGHFPDSDVPRTVVAAHAVAAERGGKQFAVGAESPGHLQLLGPPDVGVPQSRPHGLPCGGLDHLRLAAIGLHGQLAVGACCGTGPERTAMLHVEADADRALVSTGLPVARRASRPEE